VTAYHELVNGDRLFALETAVDLGSFTAFSADVQAIGVPEPTWILGLASGLGLLGLLGRRRGRP